MHSMIYNPLEEFQSKFKEAHAQHTNAFFEALVARSGVDIEQNRKTVALYNEYRENLAKLRKKLNWRLFFRVLMCLTILLIPLVIWKLNPAIKTLRDIFV